jgi:hypothetical protein
MTNTKNLKKTQEIHNNQLFNTNLQVNKQVLSLLSKRLGDDYNYDDLLVKIEDKLVRNGGNDRYLFRANKLCFMHQQGEITALVMDVNGIYWINKTGTLNYDNIDGSIDVLDLRKAEEELGWSVSNSMPGEAKIMIMIRRIALIELLNLYRYYDSENLTNAEIAHKILVKEFKLNDSNGYVYVNDEGVVEEFIVEASNNASLSLDVDDWDESTTVEEILSAVVKKMEEFSADEEFDELYSPNFGENNQFTPSKFLRMLMADEVQFHETANQISKYLLKNNH